MHGRAASGRSYTFDNITGLLTASLKRSDLTASKSMDWTTMPDKYRALVKAGFGCAPPCRRKRDDWRSRLRRGGEHFIHRLAMRHVESVHEHIDARIERQTPGQRPVVGGRTNETHQSTFLPLLQFIEHAVL